MLSVPYEPHSLILLDCSALCSPNGTTVTGTLLVLVVPDM